MIESLTKNNKEKIMQSESNKDTPEILSDLLKHMEESGKILSIYSFCIENNINQGNFRASLKPTNSLKIQIEWLQILVEKYGVSAHYLLTGKGKMYDKEIFVELTGSPSEKQIQDTTEKISRYIKLNKIDTYEKKAVNVKKRGARTGEIRGPYKVSPKMAANIQTNTFQTGQQSV